MSRGPRATAPHHVGPAQPATRATIDLDSAGDTPILREYRDVKERFPDAIVMARLGDFYEMFGDDAAAAAPLLGLTLTGRSFGGAGRVPMCGVPHSAVTQHIRRLLDSGHQVALWDQVGEVSAGKLVAREVTRVLSPGMVVEDDLLEPSAVLRCVAVAPRAGRIGVAAFDASTGELQLSEVGGGLETQALADECTRLDAAELLVAEGSDVPVAVAAGAARTALPAALFDLGAADRRLLDAAGVAGVATLDLEDLPAARCAAGALLAYCERSRLALTPGFVRIAVRRAAGLMRLDAQTRRNLELVAPMSDRGASLLSLLDRTRTPMGARLLRARLQQPLVDVASINARLDSVAKLARAHDAREELAGLLGTIADLERLMTRCIQGIASPRDLAAIRNACVSIPTVRDVMADIDAAELADARAACIAPAPVLERLQHLLVDEPPATARDGGAIRRGADPELDAMHDAGADARTFIAGLEEHERERTGIRSLRVGYNRVFGYYIEVPHAHRDRIPADFIRKQTLVGAERYITPDLKEQEAIVLHARERVVAREQQILTDASRLVASCAPQLYPAAAALAVLDVSQALARVAADERWVRPEVDGSGVVDIEAGRHPLVERALGRGRFVANDCTLDSAERLLVLTGPNMAGKSTYLRQVSLIVLLAQVGSFVPAARARIGVCDRIFTRVGAHDDLSGGMSTFMVEMAETAAILRQASERSLVVLDEIGRGTSTYDGVSIAQAVVEHIHDAPHLNCRTLFATHYHELTALADRLPRVRNARVEVVEQGERIAFLHRIVPGGADRSYGIHVAKLAGVPAGVLARAREVLAGLERTRPLAQRGDGPDQLTLAIAAPAAHPVVEELAELDIDTLSPIAALNKLAELRDRAST